MQSPTFSISCFVAAPLKLCGMHPGPPRPQATGIRAGASPQRQLCKTSMTLASDATHHVESMPKQEAHAAIHVSAHLEPFPC